MQLPLSSLIELPVSVSDLCRCRYEVGIASTGVSFESRHILSSDPWYTSFPAHKTMRPRTFVMRASGAVLGPSMSERRIPT